jgi:hypothetical protein
MKLMKYKKKELLYTIDLLSQANQLIKNASAQNLMSMENTLMDCQTSAIRVGTYLDTQGEKAEPIVRVLEDYCENIYQQSLNLNNVDICRKISKIIIKQLNQVSISINYDLPKDKTEIVFLPYNAAMWDSMESIWMAASDDETCDTYVIPIPYYEKNPYGSFGLMHYEGDRYPDYVPIIDWKEYLIPERRPDVIYIHNPYDDSNLVTSVHPAFYSVELKKYTDMLVYVPYFIGVNSHIEEHFCTTKGVLFANKVIVESEKVKRNYIDVIHKFEYEINCKGIFGDLDKKILALGSPKLDCVKRFDNKKAELPKEWERIIRRADGSKKKIVLYNTTIDALLKSSDRYLDKIEETLDCFRNNDAAALLWRPHPLLKTTIRALREDLYLPYEKIVSRFIEERWGIFDESADVERAISISDAYYGDYSSVITLYQATGKPIMVQSVGDA